MTPNEAISQIELWTVAILAAVIAYEFYKSVNGRLRILLIRLFVTKVWVYGGAAIYYLILPDIPFIYIRIILVAPMFIVMLQLWGYIRMRD